MFAGIDQGIDFTGPGPVYALGPGQVTRVETSGSGWPGQGAVLDYLLTGGPKKGQTVYVAEDFSPAAGIAVGKVVSQGQVLGQATGSGQAPGIEVGFANPGGGPLAALLPRGSDYAAAGEPQGANFLSFVENTPPPGVNAGNVFGTSPLPGVSSILNRIGGAVSNPVTSAAGTVGNAVGSAASSAIQPFEAAGSFFSWITNTKNLQRLGEMVGGGVFIFIGVIMVGRAATSSSAASQVSGAARTAAAPVRQVRTSRGRASAQRASQARTRAPARRQGFAAAPTDRELRRQELRKRRAMGRMQPGEEIPF